MASNLNLNELYERFYDPQKMKERYFTPESAFFDDTVVQMFSNYIKLFSSGCVKGDSLIGLSYGPHIYYTLPACEYFNKITFACSEDKSIQEIQKWLKNEPDALDSSRIIKKICELQGSGDTWVEKEHMLKRKVQQLLKHDVMSSNPLSPIIHPQADCLVLAHCLEHFVTDKKTYCEALKNVSSLLKPGGTLIMSALLEATFYTCGDFKFPVLCLDDDFLKDAIKGAGYVIQENYIYLRVAESLYDVVDHKYIFHLKACKERET
ncbi:nicotinamide N-methyltransferase-like [Lissotriton helveticus]